METTIKNQYAFYFLILQLVCTNIVIHDVHTCTFNINMYIHIQRKKGILYNLHVSMQVSTKYTILNKYSHLTVVNYKHFQSFVSVYSEF